MLFFAVLIGGTACLLPCLGGEFMPQLEEGNLWIRDTAPLNISLARQAAISKEARAIMASYPEVVDVVNQIGRTDDATDTDGYYNSEFFVPLRPQKQWPAVVEQAGLAALAVRRRSGRAPRTSWSRTWMPSWSERSPALPGISRRTSATT